MTRSIVALALLCAAAPLAPPLTAQSFEGTVTMNITNDDGASRTMSFMLKGGKMRFDPGGAQVSVIIDPATQRMTVIMNAQKMYMQRDFSDAVPAMQQMAAGKGPAVVKGRKLYIYPEQYEGQECDPLIFCTGPVPAQQVDPLIHWLMDGGDAFARMLWPLLT